MKNPLVSVIVCTKDRAQVLKNFALKSLFKQNYPNYEILVIDDASEDNTLQMLNRYQNKIRVVKNKKGIGLCYVRNLGIKNAKGEIIAFIDDDCIADKNWIKELVRPYKKDKKVMVVGGRIYGPGKLGNADETIFGGNFSFKREIFSNFSFDTNIYFNKCSYYDDTDLLYRIKNKNLKIVYTSKAIVKHFHKPAKYRKNIEFGAPMNCAYMHAKKMNLWLYYWLLLSAFIKFQKKNYQPKNNQEIIVAFRTAKGLFLSKNMTPLKFLWIFYTLLFTIPIRAKLQNAKEEDMANL